MTFKPICGTGLLAGRKAAIASDFQTALRFWARGAHRKAVDLLTKSLAEWVDPDFGPHRALVENGRARLRRAMRTSMEPPDDRALDARSKELEEWIATIPDTSVVARSEQQLADIAAVVGDLERAERLLRSAIARLGAEWGTDHLEVMGYRDGLATVLLACGRGAEAEDHIRAVRELHEAKGYPYRTEPG